MQVYTQSLEKSSCVKLKLVRAEELDIRRCAAQAIPKADFHIEVKVLSVLSKSTTHCGLRQLGTVNDKSTNTD